MIENMGAEIDQKPVKLVASIIFKDENSREAALSKLKNLYGELEPLEKLIPFDYTDYYYEEMGRPLMRKLVCFKKLAGMENISRIKLKTNRIEKHACAGKKRTVNIDPGYVTEAKLVLLTTNDYTHRVYLGRRIFAESTLFFKDGKFEPWPWTYPDYASEELTSYFEKVREIYLQDVKKL
ncbi:MAG: DUF4416 family protein [Candidatus Omnitrophota bacterium]